MERVFVLAGLVIRALVVSEAVLDAIVEMITSIVDDLRFYSLLAFASNISARYSRIITFWPFDMLIPES